MDNRFLTAFNRLKGTINQFFTTLCQHLYSHIIGNHFTFNKLTQKIKLNLTGSRKSNFNLFKSQLNQILKHFNLLTDHHGINQCLVSITKIHTTPDRGFFNLLTRPFSLRIVYYRIFSVTLIVQHFFSSFRLFS